LSFFDEVDDPPTERARRPRSPRGRYSSGPPRPPRDQQAIQVRRVGAIALLIVVIVVIAVLVRGCEKSSTNSALENYTTSVNSLIKQSSTTVANVFGVLSSGITQSGSPETVLQLNTYNREATATLEAAQRLGAPGQMQSAESYLVLTLQMRQNAIAQIDAAVPPATGGVAGLRVQAATDIAAAMAQFYASDVIYQDYVSHQIAGQLNHAGIKVNGATGQPLDGSQVLTDLSWLTTSAVATKLGIPLPVHHPFIPGLHGHSLNSVSVAGITLTPVPANNPTINASPAPTFTLNFTDSGNFNEYNVKCKVAVKNETDSEVTVVPETLAHQNSSCDVTLPHSPGTGIQQVTATIERVKGEKNFANNHLTYAITFK
jgi:hypothetical protein